MSWEISFALLHIRNSQCNRNIISKHLKFKFGKVIVHVIDIIFVLFCILLTSTVSFILCVCNLYIFFSSLFDKLLQTRMKDYALMDMNLLFIAKTNSNMTVFCGDLIIKILTNFSDLTFQIIFLKYNKISNSS